MLTERLSKQEAQDLLRHCIEDGEIIYSKHFRQELANEGVSIPDLETVLRKGIVFDEPEFDVKFREWHYAVEGKEPGSKWLKVVYCFKEEDSALLITVHEVKKFSK
jgi:hypothetical protein